jgi:DNA-binding NarL/FixJ family response regulator
LSGHLPLAYELALREGEAVDPMDMLRSLPSELRHGDLRSVPVGRLRHGHLSRREIEILQLVGRGLSDPEIAEKLYISPKTASVHIANINGKLGVDSRRQIARRARELGLE